ncbi:hypothetical protein RCL_jg17694.t1 [Rhizophagus clarus]|uniref:Uncharacterized protein n=1 Tax=Rhizophagus clarus TaxID=94130 RepID=A0A8H3L7P5_9GLOM|nr:hypothetical protein RCL_jg17694.t1 [Rhizophagus clarus]
MDESKEERFWTLTWSTDKPKWKSTRDYIISLSQPEFIDHMMIKSLILKLQGTLAWTLTRTGLQGTAWTSTLDKG